MKIRVATIAVMAAVLAAGVFGPTPGYARDYIYADYLPPKHALNTVAIPPLIKELKGVINWRLSTSGQLITGKTDIQTVGSGVVDAGFVLSAYHQELLKDDFTLNDLMYAGQDPLAVTGAALETHFMDCPSCVADYKKQHTIFLGGYSTFDFGIMCNSEIHSAADLKGKKLRTTGAYGRWAAAVGGVPVSMTTDDMVQALERGQLDCIVGPIAWVRRFPIMDSLKSVVDYPFGVFPEISFMTMNLDSWKGLSSKQKAALVKAVPGAIARIMIEGYAADSKKARAALHAHGVSLYEGKEEFDKIRATFRKKDILTVIKRAKARGVKDPQHIVDAFEKNLKTWQGLMAHSKRDSASFAKLLWDQIYSKLDPAKL